ncbi:MAG: alginate lyase family protein [Verrucomicrobiota bacterium]
MKNRFTTVIKKDSNWWIGWVEEIPGVNSRGKTRVELLRNLRAASTEVLSLIREEIMKRQGSLIILFALPFFLNVSLQAGSVSLETNEVLQLRMLIDKDKTAAAQFAEIHDAAIHALGERPDPIPKIISEGHLVKDPKKIRSVAALKDTQKISSLAWAWAATGDERYAAQARKFLLAWAKVNQADGNDINESKFEPMLVAYDLLRFTFSESERQIVDDWWRRKAKALWKGPRGGGNWFSHNLKTVGLIALTLNDDLLFKDVKKGFFKQVGADIKPDGACTDFYVRDSFHYHIYSIEPLLSLAHAAERHGEQFFDYRATNGASLRRAVDFVVPYAEGKKTHIEFANSKSDFDRVRAKNGETAYKPHPWKPTASIRMFSGAAWFDSKYGKIAAKLSGKPDQPFINWRMVIDAASPRYVGDKP